MSDNCEGEADRLRAFSDDTPLVPDVNCDVRPNVDEGSAEDISGNHADFPGSATPLASAIRVGLLVDSISDVSIQHVGDHASERRVAAAQETASATFWRVLLSNVADDSDEDYEVDDEEGEDWETAEEEEEEEEGEEESDAAEESSDEATVDYGRDSDESACLYEDFDSLLGAQVKIGSSHEIAREITSRVKPRMDCRVLHKKSKLTVNDRVNVAHMIQGREMGLSSLSRWSPPDKCHVSQRFLPVNGPTVVESMTSRAYIGQFLASGSMFVAAFQDRRIRLYDVDSGWTLRKDILAKNLRWTITDTALTPDQNFLVYSTISPDVHLVNVGSHGYNRGVESLANVTDIHETLTFSDEDERGFGIWSLQFSSDGREIVAGSNLESIHIYDLEANRPSSRIHGHDGDVNAVTFADASSDVIISGSDDALIKVWDRRASGGSHAPAGMLIGHLEGISHVSSKDDGRYLISNSKDQTIKLWDLRMMRSHGLTSRRALSVPASLRQDWDYRWMDYPARGKRLKHPRDISVMTYEGHFVLQTLIRAYFSPIHTTGQRYIYTGSGDGIVYIYDVLSGALVSKLRHHRAPVRDCSWHPYDSLMASVSWDGQVACWTHAKQKNIKLNENHLSNGDAYEL